MGLHIFLRQSKHGSIQRKNAYRKTMTEPRTNPDPKAEQDRQWAAWMTQPQDGDAVAYKKLLGAAVPLVRPIVGKRINHPDKIEDAVQEVLYVDTQKPQH